jgi:hypothetical protein
MQLDLAPPADDAERAKLASALDELMARATALRSRMEPDTTDAGQQGDSNAQRRPPPRRRRAITSCRRSRRA